MEVVDRVSFVSKVSLVLKATADDNSPIPGYLYKEINSIFTSYESNGYCESLLEFLVDRLEKKSAHSKLKVLKLMKYIVENGNPDFRHGLRRQAQGIKEATKFSGPSDPLHGNVQYVMVRKIAQELSECLFDTETDTNEHQEKVSKISKIGVPTGMGNVCGVGKMEGFGNSPKHQPKTVSKTILDSFSKIVEKMNETTPPDSQMAMLLDQDKTRSHFTPLEIEETSTPVIEKGPLDKVRSVRHVPGCAGGGWEETDVRKQSTGSATDLAERIEAVTTEDWSAEEELVSSLAENIKPLPLREDLDTFRNKCASVNCDKVIELINKQLVCKEQLAAIMRNLLMLEWLIKSDFVSLDSVASTCKSNLMSVYNQQEGMTKAKARKLIRILEKLTNTEILPLPTVTDSNSSSVEQTSLLTNISTSFSQMCETVENPGTAYSFIQQDDGSKSLDCS